MKAKFKFVEAVTYSFRVMAKRPLAVLMHALMSIAVVVAFGLLVARHLFPADLFSDTPSDPPAGFGAYVGLLFLFYMVFGAAWLAGALRILVRDKVRWWLPLQLGLDEIRTFLLTAMLFVGTYALMLVCMLVMMPVMMLAMVPFAADGTEPDVAAVIGVSALMMALYVATMAATAYLIGRLGVMVPLSVRDRRFNLNGWGATRGCGWGLLGTHASLYFGVTIAAMVPYFAFLMAVGLTDPELASNPAPFDLADVPVTSWGLLALVLVAQATGLFVLMGPGAYVATLGHPGPLSQPVDPAPATPEAGPAQVSEPASDPGTPDTGTPDTGSAPQPAR